MEHLCVKVEHPDLQSFHHTAIRIHQAGLSSDMEAHHEQLALELLDESLPEDSWGPVLQRKSCCQPQKMRCPSCCLPRHKGWPHREESRAKGSAGILVRKEPSSEEQCCSCLSLSRAADLSLSAGKSHALTQTLDF